MADITGTSASESINGTSGDDSIAGGAGNDTITGGGGNDTIDGGQGTGDVLVLDDVFSHYSVTVLDGDHFRLQNATTGEDITVSGIEYVQFTDQTWTSVQLRGLDAPNIAPAFGDAPPGSFTSGIAGLPEFGGRVVLAPDGSMYFVGEPIDVSTGQGTAIEVWHLNSNGTVDLSFNPGGAPVSIPFTNATLLDATVQTDGKLLVSTSSAFGEFAILRVNTDGSLDTGWSGDGIATTLVRGFDQGRAIALQSDGKVLLTGYSQAGGGATREITLVRYNSDGSLDSSFGSGGVVAMGSLPNSRSTGVQVLANGDILVVGAQISGATGEHTSLLLARYLPNGTLDATFGTSGLVTTAIADHSSAVAARGLAVQSDGKIVVLGYEDAGNGNGTSHMFVMRYNGDGSVDTSFGADGDSDGKVTIPVSLYQDLGRDIRIDSNGKIVIAGTSSTPDFGDVQTGFLVRLNSDGSLDTAFGNGGVVLSPFVYPDAGEFQGVREDASGNLLVATFAALHGSPVDSDPVALRYTSSGVLDPTFNAVDPLAGTTLAGPGAVTKLLWGRGGVYDADLVAKGSYGGSTLTLQRHGGADASDVFAASGPMQFAAGHVVLNGTDVGTVTNTGGVLTVAFSANASQSEVAVVMNLITWQDASSSPGDTVQFDWTFDDGSGAGNAVVTAMSTVNVQGSLTGTGGNDSITATGSSDVVQGLAGNDALMGLGGDDLINGGAGNDTISAGTGKDSVDGGGGLDTLVLQGTKNEYTFTQIDGSHVHIVNAARGEDVVVTNTELVQFSDSTKSMFGLTLPDTNVAPVFGTSPVGSFAGGIPSTNNGAWQVVNGQGGGYYMVGSGGPNGDVEVWHLNADGTLDHSYNPDGPRIVPLVSGGFVSGIVQADGKLLIGTTALRANGFGEFAQARLNSDGSLDTSFGGGTGVVQTPIGTTQDQQRAMALQSDGKIVAVGFSQSGGGSTREVTLVRYNSDGSLDNTFGTSGVSAGTTFPNSRIAGVQVAGNGDIYVVGTQFIGPQVNLMLGRYHADGTADTSFGPNGYVVTAIADNSSVVASRGLAMQPDGKLLVLAEEDSGHGDGSAHTFVLRYNADGSLDTTFNGDGDSDGRVDLVLSDYHDLGRDIQIESDGKILIAGTAVDSTGNVLAGFVVRLNADGSRDTGFGTNGVAIAPVHGDQAGEFLSVREDANGDIVVASQDVLTTDPNESFAVAYRFTHDGQPDTGFNVQDSVAGKTLGVPGLSIPMHWGQASLYDADLLAQGNYGGSTLTVVRHGGPDANDVFDTNDNVVLSGGNVTIDGRTVGFTDQTGNVLSIGFNNSASQDDVKTVLNSISWSNASATPGTTVTFDWSFDDGSGAANAVVTAQGTVEVVPFTQGTAGNDSLAGDGSDNAIDGLAGNDTMAGNGGDDLMAGDLGNDSMDGGAGNDTMLGNEGRDSMHGGAGNDVIDGGEITDRVNYSDLNFLLYNDSTGAVTIDLRGIKGDGSQGHGTVVDGMGGIDTVKNVDWIVGSTHNDTILGSSAIIVEQFEGGKGDDYIDGGAFIDPLNNNDTNRVFYGNATAAENINLTTGTATGGDGNDTLVNINQVRGSGFGDTITGSDRSDYTEAFDGMGGNDTIDGKGGFDIIRFDGPSTSLLTSGVTVNLATGTANDGMGGTDTFFNIEGAQGTALNDTLIGGNPANGTVYNDGKSEIFRGGAGNDFIDGGQGYDRVDYNTLATTGVNVTLGGTGNGTAQDGQGGTDTLVNIEAVRGSIYGDTLTGSDTGIFESFEGREGNDTIDGKGGTDRADYNSSPNGVNVNLATGVAQDGWGFTDSLANIENVRGARFANDTIVGNGANNFLEGQGGADSLAGGDGNDTINGGADNDTIDGGNGNDNLFGNDGDDSITGGAGNDYIQGGNGNDTIDGGADWDTAAYQLNGSGVAFTATNNGTQPDGSGGTDTLTNIEEIDVYGTGGNDTIAGNAQRNYIEGWAGDDSLTGGGGNDTFAYNVTQLPLGHDTITDLSSDDDLRFYVPGNGPGQFAINSIVQGDDPSGLQAGQVMIGTPSGGVTRVYVGVDGNGGADITIDLQGSYAAGDFRFNNDPFGSSLRWVPGQVINGTPGNDNLNGGPGNDTINGGDGNDNIFGGGGNDSISGGNGDDYINPGGPGNSTVDGGAGNDVLGMGLGGAGPGVGVNFALGEGPVVSDNLGNTFTISNIEEIHLYGGDGDDSITGNSLRNWIAGNQGNDTLTGGGGRDTFGYDITMANGNDTITDLQAGEDLNFYNPNTPFSITSIVAGDNPAGLQAGQMMIGTPSGGTTKVYVGTDGNAGADITITLQGSYAAGDFHITGNSVTFQPGSVINGTAGNDQLNGTSGNDTINAGDGNDNINGNGGSDVINAGNGDDYINPGAPGSSTIDGGAGHDVVGIGLGFNGPGVNFTIGNGPVIDNGSGGTFTLSNVEEIDAYGSNGDDTITGNSMRNWIAGNGGNDTLTGGGGDDTFGYDVTQPNGTSDRITDFSRGDNLWFYVPGNGPGQFAITNIYDSSHDINTLVRGEVAFSAFDSNLGITTVRVGTSDTPGTYITIELAGNFDPATFTYFNGDFGASLNLINHAPVQNPGGGILTTAEDTPLTFTAAQFLAGFTDPDGDPMTVDFSGIPEITQNPNGSYTYTPPLNFNGTTFSAATAVVTDSHGASNAIQVQFNVTPVNDAPAFAGGFNGLATVGHDGTGGNAMDIALQSDGKLVASLEGGANNFLGLMRLNADGTPDASYGTNGLATFSLAGYSIATNVDAKVAVDAAGGTILATSYTGSGESGMLAVRFNADGTLDTTFNGGLGYDKIALTSNEILRSMTLDSSGHIVMTGWDFDFPASNRDTQVVRLNSDGTRDATFGTNGVATLSLSAGDERPDDVTVLADGSMYVAGRAADANGVLNAYLIKLTASGALDTSFHGTGEVSFMPPGYTRAISHGVAVQADGSIIVVGFGSRTGGGGLGDDGFITRLHADGTLDTSFNGSGWLFPTPTGTATQTGVWRVALDGTKIIVTGDAVGNDNAPLSFILRLNSDGTPDTSYGQGGYVVFQASNALEPVLLGHDVAVPAFVGDFNAGTIVPAILRLNADGSIDTAYDAAPGNPTIVPPGQSITVTGADLLRGWSDADGDVIHLSSVTADHGSVQVQGSGESAIYTITPANGYSGQLTLTYTVQDSAGATAQGTRGYAVTPSDVNLVGTSGNDSLVGGQGNDTLSGLAGNDTLVGNDGNDQLTGGAGNDSISGGNGWDTANYNDAGTTAAVTVNLATGLVTGGAGSDTLSGIEQVMGSNFNDNITGNAQDNSLFGNGGTDTINGGDGNDFIQGGAGNDSLNGGGNGFFDTVDYGDATAGVAVNLVTNRATGGSGSDTLAGFEGVSGSNFNDTLTGDDNNNNFQGQAGNDSIVGAGGWDSAGYYNATTGVNVNLATGIAKDGQGGTDTLSGIEQVDGSRFNDTLVGDGNNNSFSGNEGDDFIDGGAGNGDNAGYWSASGGVVVNLATGTATGAAGNDTLVGIENVTGSSFNDTLIGDGNNNFLDSNGGNDSIDGGGGFDTAGYFSVGGGIRVDLNTGQVTGAVTGTVTNIEAVNGTLFDDTLIGDGNNNTFAGNLGNDSIVGNGGNDNVSYWEATVGVNVNLATGLATGWGNDTLSGIEGVSGSNTANDTLIGDSGNNGLNGNGGNDSLVGNDGNDFLDGGLGNDTLVGGNGSDTANYSNASGAVNINLTTNTVTGADGNDSLSGIENANGSNAGDTIVGSAGNNTLIGNGGNDSISGGGGGDFIRGGAGNDTIDGGIVTDRLNYADGNSLSYSDSTSGIVMNLSGITGDGSVGTGTVQDGLGGTDTVANVQFITGSAFNDSIVGSSAKIFEQFDGGAGNDTINGGALIDPVGQTDANRVLYQSATAAVTVDLGAGTATGGGGNDTLINITQVRGSNFGDVITGSDRTDYTEQYDGRAGNDTIDGKGGFDTLRYDLGATTGVNVNLVTGTATDGQGGTDTFINIEGVFGSNFDDTLIGGNAANGTVYNDGKSEVFRGGAGNDFIDGGQGYDRADYTSATTGAVVTLGGTGTGTAQDGQGGTDTLVNIEAVRGSDFNDTLTGSDDGVFESFEGRAGNDLIDGKGGADRADYTSSTAAVNVNLATGTAADGWGGTDTLLNIEVARGSSFNDTITGSAGANYLQGQAGNDSIAGGDGDDTLDAGTGVDTVDGGNGANDVLMLKGARADYTVTRPNATDTNLVDAATGENITVRNVELFNFSDGQVSLSVVQGNSLSTFNDSFVGTDGNDTIDALAGDDTVDGRGGDDTIFGNAGNDSLMGGDGNDTLNGGIGTDTLLGGTGNDTYVVDVAADAIVENPGEGTDTVNVASTAAGTYTMAANVENAAVTSAGTLAVHVIGNASDNMITGNGGNNSLTGGAGNDTLDGGVGNDTLFGGAGNDTYVVNVATDVVNEIAAGSDGNDTVLVSFAAGGTYVMTANVENAVVTNGLAVNVTGSVDNNTITGGAGNNLLSGGDGNDTLVSSTGNDTLDGGNGNDTVVVMGARAAYTVTRTTATDTTLVNAATGENITLRNDEAVQFTDGLKSMGDLWGNNPSAFPDSLVGTEGNDTIDGLAGNDTIMGLGGDDSLIGGAGSDSLIGGLGNDTYNVDALTDAVVENDGEGVDQVNVGLTAAGIFNMATNAANVENGFVTSGGTLAVGIIGNALDNFLQGNGASNNLSGGDGNDTLNGGAGKDTLAGGAGDDTYYIDLATDIVNESVAGSSGNDTVNILFTAAATYTLTTGVENAVVLSSVTGINITGNASANMITGNAGNNTLLGNAGNDTIYGGGGTDSVDGGADTDTLVLAGALSDYSITRPTTTTVMFSKAGTTVTAANIEFVQFDEGDAVAISSLVSQVGSPGNDTLVGGDGDDTFDGAAGNDIISGGGGNDTLSGGAGLDTITGGAGNDFLDGGLGNDVYVFNQGDGDDVIAQNDTVSSDVDVLRLTQSGLTSDMVTFSRGAQTYNDLVVTIQTGDDDTGTVESVVITDFFTNDSVNIGTIDQVVLVSAGITFTQAQIKALVLSNTGDGDHIFVGYDSADSITGGGNDDWMMAGANNDTVNGNAGNDSMFGGSGNDVLNGGDGNDLIVGGAGNDTLAGGAGDDMMSGGAGSDTYVVGLNGGHDVISEPIFPLTDDDLESGIGPIYAITDGDYPLSAENDVIAFQAGVNEADIRATRADNDLVLTNGSTGDTVTVENFFANGISTIERVTFSSGTSWSATQIRAKVLVPSGGDDSIVGYLAGEKLNGLAGNDTIDGREGNDTINGGAGNDVLTGGKGADKFVFDTSWDGTDTITDFQSGVDTIMLSNSLFAGLGSVGQRISADGVHLAYDSGSGQLVYDADGAGGNDGVVVAIIGTDTHPLTLGADFVITA